MTPDEIAQKFESRPGFSLVDYAEVGLPIYRLLLDVVSLDRREIPSTHEFLLKLIDAGIVDAPTLQGFLGLDRRVFDSSLGSLLDNGWIVEESGSQYVLTKKGRSVLQEGADISPQNETISIDFDGIVRKPISLGREVLAKPSELKHSGKIEIRPYPAMPPNVGDLDLREVQKTNEKQVSRRGEAKEILAINRIAKKIRLFRNAVCLVYKANTSKKVEIDFVINGSLSQEHSNEFARNDGPSKMGFCDSVTSSDIRQTLLRQLDPEVRQLIPDEGEVAKARLEVATSKMLLDSAKSKLSRSAGKSTERQFRADFEKAMQRFEDAKKGLDDFHVRPLAVYEYAGFLADAMNNSERSVILSTPKILDTVADGYFLRNVNLLLEKNVRITIYINGKWVLPLDNGSQIISAMHNIERKNEKITLKRTRLSPVNWLISDDKYAVITSFPWLSFKDARRPLSRMSGLVVQDPKLVALLTETFRSREISK